MKNDLFDLLTRNVMLCDVVHIAVGVILEIPEDPQQHHGILFPRWGGWQK
jgi:hypothetical protein